MNSPEGNTSSVGNSAEDLRAEIHSSRVSWATAAGGRVLAVRNPVAGRRRLGHFEAAIEGLRRLGLAIDAVDTRQRGDAEEIAARASAAEHDLLLVAGGDGTINEAINGIVVARRPPALAVLPLGTTNVLAREIGMPTNPARFAAALTSGVAHRAWLGEVCGRRFALMASVGADACIVAAVDEALKRRIGKGAYLVAALRQLVRGDRPRYRVMVDGRPFDASAAIVCKGRFYGGSFVVAPHARIAKPGLHVLLLSGSGRLDLCGYAARLALGGLCPAAGLWRAAGAVLLPAHHVEIDGPADDPVQADGDIVSHLPALIRADPAPITLMMARRGQ